jgi:hypothetical protein
MTAAEFWLLLSNIVTVFGFPLAIYVFVYQRGKDRESAEEEVFLGLSDAYADFLKLVIANPDLRLRSAPLLPNPTEEQRERMLVIFDILVALFERAYILTYAPDISGEKLRRWHSWEDYMREWCRRDDFRCVLPELLEGEDSAFAGYIRRIALEEGAHGGESVRA